MGVKRGTVLSEAQSLVAGHRLEEYGPPEENLHDIGEVWSVYVRRAWDDKGYLDGHDVCAMVILMKELRQSRGYHRDSTVDVAGYARLQEILGP